MEERIQKYRNIVRDSELVIKKVDNVAAHLAHVCTDNPDRITLDFILAEMQYIRQVVKEFREIDFWRTNLTSPPAIVRMNADSEDRSGAGAGPGTLPTKQ